MTPRSGPGGPGSAPRAPKRTPRAPQERPGAPRGRPKRHQKGASALGGPPGALREPFWSDFRASGEPFWSHFGRILEFWGSSLRSSPGSVLDPLRPPFFPHAHVRNKDTEHTQEEHAREEGHARDTGGRRQNQRRNTPELREEHERDTGGARRKSSSQR